jgi:hypothetical protein
VARRTSGVLILVFLLAHLAMLPRTLEDLDSINFAFGVRHFDVAKHQPHPPGYPVFIAMSKVSTGVLRALGVGAPAVRGLAVWSAIAGTLAIPAVFLFFNAVEGRRRVAWWSVFLMAASPLYWFNALRPLSDVAGFAAASWAIALLVTRTERSIMAAALVAGAAIGIRSQTAVLTLPLLAFVLLSPPGAAVRARIMAMVALAIGALAWAVPLLMASGGVDAYLQALGTQAGEDFSGVVMLWTHRTPRVAAQALANTFIWPWGWWLGIAVSVLAVVGAVRIALRSPRAAGLLAVTFVPYAVFHLLYQETVTTRYALPLLPVVAYCATVVFETPRVALPAFAIAFSAASFFGTMYAAGTYAREGAPVFRAFDDMATTAHGGERVDVLGMHASARRAAQWAEPILPAPVAQAPHGQEWLALLATWKRQPNAHAWFAADPKRTDLALFDPRSRDLVRAYRWDFIEPPYIGGARPGNIDWYRLLPPGWMLDRGWSLTAEIAGVTARDRLGPQVAPSVAWIRSRADETTLMIGGRNLGSSTASVSVSLEGRSVATWSIAPGFFVRTTTLSAGSLQASSAYVPLEVSSAPAVVPLSLEQFDLQGPATPMFAYGEGWQEPEYNPATGLAWRWMSEESVLWVRPIGRDVIVTLTGESPLRYYRDAPHVQVLVGDGGVASFDPTADFTREITIPAALLASAGGRVTLESSRFFVPGASSGSGDQRHLAIRIYAVSVR